MPQSNEQNRSNTISQVRVFNRFYTRHMGILNERFMDGRFSLPELRILYELTDKQPLSISDLVQELNMDQGYVSRLVSSLAKQQVLVTEADSNDRRRKLIKLSEQGLHAYRAVEALASEQLAQQMKHLDGEQQLQLVSALQQVQQLLVPQPLTSVTVRPLQRGDLGQIARRHAILYGQEQGWDQGFELAVMQVMAEFLQKHPAPSQAGWVAEVNGEFAGSIFAMYEAEGIARLRCLLVEPKFRSHGLGNQLIEQCLTFCRQQSYRKVVLWTCDALIQARKLYARHGFECTKSWPETEFGQNLQSEHWQLDLS